MLLLPLRAKATPKILTAQSRCHCKFLACCNNLRASYNVFVMLLKAIYGIVTSGFIYEQNNHVAFVDKETKRSEAFHSMMDFIKECKCSNAMLHGQTIYYVIVEQMWTSVRYTPESKTHSVVINDINGETVRAVY